MEFCCRWLKNSPHAKKYRIGGVLFYNEGDFIDYLNCYVFPEEPSVLIENIGQIESEASLPERYRSCPQFHF